MSEMKLIEFRALVRLTATERGGRAYGIRPGVYRPWFRTRDVISECQVVAIDKGSLEPGEEGQCTVRVIDLNGISPLLRSAAEFELLEGPKIVATGRILEHGRPID